MRDDTIKLLSDDDGAPKRGVLYGSHNTVVPYCVKCCPVGQQSE